MAPEEFLKYLSRALRSRPRRVAANGQPANDPGEPFDHRAAIDLITAFDAADFSDLPAGVRKALGNEFRLLGTALRSSPPDRAAAADALHRIAEVVGPEVRAEWVAAVEELVGQAEAWARARDWAVKRFPKEIDEGPLGRYEVPQLLVHLREGRVLLDPQTRFVAGGTGLIDAYAMPSLGGRPLVRRAGGWEFLPAKANGRSRAWSEAAFEAVVRGLVRDAA